MKIWGGLAPVIVFVLSYTAAFAQQEGGGGADALVFKEIIVTAAPEAPETEKITEDILDFGTFVNIGEALDSLPGVSVVRRGASSTEPVIRGLGWERVQTQVGAVPIYGACPGRMDPPVTYLQPDTVQQVVVSKGIPSVTLGPFGTGGRVVVSTDYVRSPGAPDEFGGWLTSTYDGSRGGYQGGVGLKGGNKWVDFYGAFSGLDYGDYESAGDVDVPADHTEFGGAVSFGVKPTENQRWWNGLNILRDNGREFPAMPMDSDRTDTYIYNTGYRIDFPGSALEQFEVSGGFALIDHTMSNSGKPNWDSMLRAKADTTSDSFAGRAKQNWRITPTALLTTGVDYFQLGRDGLRERFIVPKDKLFYDHIWPDTSQWDLGGFMELNVELTPRWRLRLGGRADNVRSEADAVDEPGLGGIMTIREQFVKFYGPEAADVNRSEFIGAGNALLEYYFTDNLAVHLGSGVGSRPAGITERFYAFAPATGGFQVGNPTLDPETKLEVDLGINWKTSRILFSASVFHYWVQDYIHQFQLAQIDIDGDGATDIVKGFRNIDARLYGGEIGAVFKPIEHWSFPVSLSYVRGRNVSNDSDLPEIPAFEARTAVRYQAGVKIPWWIEFGGRFAAQQEDIDASFPEDETEGFAVFHLYAGMRPTERIRLIAGIDNLFNEDYNEHLTREAVMAVGDLSAWDEVPAPGVSFFASARYEF